MLKNTHLARPNARGIRALSFALAVGVALSLTAFGPAAIADEADETIGISAEPAAAENATGRTRFSYQVDPGQELEDAYVVSNTGTIAQTFAVFATDAFNTEEGGYGLLDTGVQPSDAGAWVTFDGGASTVSLPLEPGQSAVVPFTVRVPADASPGDHAAGVLVSAVSTDGQVLMDRRVGTRLYVRVEGDIQPTLTVASMEASYAPSLNPFAGETTVSFTVRNGGNVALAADMNVVVRGLFGVQLAEPVATEIDELLPGATRTVTAIVPGVGQWVFLQPTVELVPKVDPEALDPGPLSRVNRDTVLFVVPWALLAVLVVGGGVWGGIALSRRRDRKRAQEWIEYTEAEARRKVASEHENVGAGADGAGR